MDKQSTLNFFNSLNKNTLMETLKIEYIDLGKDFLIAKMPVNSTVHQPMGILHGGATAALAETVGSVASILLINTKKQIIKGIELSINHIKSISEGFVFATAKIIKKGRTIHIWEIRVTDEKNNLISFCKLSNIILSKKKYL